MGKAEGRKKSENRTGGRTLVAGGGAGGPALSLLAPFPSARPTPETPFAAA